MTGGLDIRDFTWTSGDTQAVNLQAFSFNNGDLINSATKWRNRLANGSRSLYLAGKISGTGPDCYRLKYDTRTWVNMPSNSFTYRYGVANTQASSVYGVCTNV